MKSRALRARASTPPRWRKFAGVAAVAAFIAGALPGAAIAHGHGGGGHGGGHAGGRHAAASAWHGGHWFHGWHGGTFGWWWAVPGDDWYAFDAPVYPYPAYPEAPPRAGNWLWCQNPAGYYPYVQQCAGRWVPVSPQGG